MTTPYRSSGPIDEGSVPGMARFVEAWARALDGTGYAPMTPADVREFLRGPAQRLAAALRAENFDASVGYQVGAELVAGNFAAADAVGRTVELVDERLLADLGLTGDNARRRLRKLIGALAAGYTRALQERTLDDQEAIRRAAFAARERAENALRASEISLWHAIAHDRLTGMPNRALFIHRLTALFDDPAATARVGVCFVGLDGFKDINDSLGHQVGDHLLAAFADRLNRAVGECGYLVARLGGDEFGILIEHTTGVQDAVAVADQVLKTLHAPIAADGYDLTVRASVGIVEGPLAGTDSSELMRSADITLHWAKADGGDRWTLFDADRNAWEVARCQLAARMPSALERGEFTLHYQPLVALADGSIVGAEALVRWQHPTLGLLAPTQFIDLAERTGLIVPLGTRLLEQACRQAKRWRMLASDSPYVSVNLAPRQTSHPGLFDEVADILARTGLPADRLQLEITESAVLETDDQTIETVRALADLGVHVAVDDFGTGYSNLAYLRDLPLSGVKIDSAFVRGLNPAADPGGADEAILTALVTLGHTLGLDVTAEGVETPAQADRLRAMGCDTAQGWQFGRPEAADHLIGLLSTHQPVVANME